MCYLEKQSGYFWDKSMVEMKRTDLPISVLIENPN